MNNNLDSKIEELVASEAFQQHCLHPTTESNLYWSKRKAENPDFIPVYENSKKAVLQLALYLPEEEFQVELADFKNKLKKTPTKTVKLYPRRRLLAYVAGLALLIASTFLLFQTNETNEIVWKTYQTEYGQTLRQQLPDGTSVVLNANSQLSVPLNWEEGKARQVKLNGEAFFDVHHSSNDDKFLVETNKGLVTVLGTKFNVQERDGQLEVVLTEGKVRLDVNNNPSLFLEPGQMAFVGDDNIVKMKKVDLDAFTAWKNHKMVFKDMSISRVVNRLKHDFGLNIVVKNEAISKRQITASIANDDPQVLLKALAAIYDLKIIQQDSTTVIIE